LIWGYTTSRQIRKKGGEGSVDTSHPETLTCRKTGQSPREENPRSNNLAPRHGGGGIDWRPVGRKGMYEVVKERSVLKPGNKAGNGRISLSRHGGHGAWGEDREVSRVDGGLRKKPAGVATSLHLGGGGGSRSLAESEDSRQGQRLHRVDHS